MAGKSAGKPLLKIMVRQRKC